MTHRADDPKNSEPPASTAQGNPPEPKFELPIEALDEIAAVAIVDSVLRVKHRKFKKGAARRPK